MATESRTSQSEHVLGVIFTSTVLLVFAGALVLLQPPDREVLRIVGPSMAPALLGRHAELTCQRCRAAFAVDAEENAVPDIVSCPHCRGVFLRTGEVHLSGGDRVVIDRAALLRRGVQRFDVVAFQIPGETSKLAVKRVIGLPGERLAIRQGDIYIDDRILAKGITQPLNVLVHDAAFTTDAWQPATRSSTWMRRDAKQKWLFQARRASESTENDWLEFHPPGLQFAHSDTAKLENVPTPLGDNDVYNPSQPRELNPVFDSTLSVTWKLSEDAVVSIRAHDGWQEWRLVLDAAHRATLIGSDNVLRTAELPSRRPVTRVQFAIIDREVYVLLNGEQVLQAVAPRSTKRSASTTPWAIGIMQGGVEIQSLQIERDVYYLDPWGLARPWQGERELAADEYFLLGDNPTVSTDSRHFGPVRREQLRGLVRKLPVE